MAESILDAAEHVAIEFGLGGLTIAAVAERAGVAVGTLYNYFPDRETIIAELFRVRRAAIKPAIAQAAESTKRLPFEQRLREFVRRLMVEFARYDRFLQISVLSDRDGNKVNRNTALMVQTVKALETIMRDGVRARLFPASRAPIYARLIHGSLRSLFLWRMCSGMQPMSDDADLVVDTFLRGISPA